jgi:putative ABC transport system permease protein
VGGAPIVGREVLLRVAMTAGEPRIDVVTIVGVVPSASVDAEGRPEREVYVPFAQRPAADLAYLDEGVLLMARATSGDASAGVEALWRVVRRVDPNLAVDYAGPASRVGRFGASIGLLTLLAQIAGALAIIALALSMAGLYGVVSHVVAGRTRELGIRAALGANRRHILEMVFADGARPVVYGLVAGLIVAAIARLSLQPYFRGTITALDWVAVGLAVMPLIIAAAVACYLPARRAARIDPSEALRDL